MTDEEKAVLEIWKATIEVQKHFNDLSMRVRNIAIIVFGALLAAADVQKPEHFVAKPSVS